MTPTAICNLALDMLPAGNITSLAEQSLQGKTANKHFAQVLSELLELVPWRWGRKRAALAQMLVNDRDNEWLYAYTLPADMAFPIQVLEETNVLPQSYEFGASCIYANVNGAYIEYVSTTDYSSRYSALFRAALIASLATRFCMPITKDMKKSDWLANKAEIAIQRAAASDWNQQGVTYGDHIPDIVKGRLGIVSAGYVAPGPETSYPDESFVEVIDASLEP